MYVSIPSRGFWFFEASYIHRDTATLMRFNPLAGILVF